MKARSLLTISVLMLFSHAIAISQWKSLSIPSAMRITSIAASDSVLLVGTEGGGAFRSSNRGSSWSAVTIGSSPQFVYGLEYKSPVDTFASGLFFAGTLSGACRSIDGGLNWTTLNVGLGDTMVYAFAVSDTDVFAGTQRGRAHSNNWGSTWTHNYELGGMYNQRTLGFCRKGDTLFAFGYEDQTGITTNDGETWDAWMFSSLKSMAVAGSSIYFTINTYPAIWFSHDDGQTWDYVVYGPLASDDAFTSILVWQNVIYAGSVGAGVVRSLDSGKTWSLINEGLTSTNITAMEIWNDTLFVGAADGTIWCRSLQEMLPVTLQRFTATTVDNQVILEWVTATETNCYGFELQRSSATEQWHAIGFVAGSGNSSCPREYSFVDRELPAGFYTYRLRQIDSDGACDYYGNVQVHLSPMPVAGQLQSYPNPANPSTTIAFTLQDPMMVSLVVYDIYGRSITTLCDGPLSAGRHAVTFDASFLSTGTYFCRLRTKYSSVTARIAVIR